MSSGILSACASVAQGGTRESERSGPGIPDRSLLR